MRREASVLGKPLTLSQAQAYLERGHGPRSLRNSSPAACQLLSFYQDAGTVDAFLKSRFYFTADRRAFRLQGHGWVPGLPVSQAQGPGRLLHQPRSPPEPGEGPLRTPRRCAASR